MGDPIAQTTALHQQNWLVGLLPVGKAAHLPVADAILHHILPEFEATMRLVAKLEWPKGTAETIIEQSYQELIHNEAQVVYDDFAACQAFDVRPRLAQITLPTLVLAGDGDRLTPLPQLQFLAQNIPQAKLVLVEGAGHMVALSRPQQVSATIESWLNAPLKPGT